MALDSFFKPKEELKNELLIERSRFIGLCYPIENEDEALKLLNSLKKTYYDASHICYAYIADMQGLRCRFSDSGEPQGTAGQPILLALTSGGFRQTLVAVVRYFGGIKLGTGGLTRAYFECAKSALASTSINKFVRCRSYRVKVSYSDFSSLEVKLRQVGYTIVSPSFNEQVEFSLVHETENLDPTDLIMDLSCGLGRVDEVGEEFVLVS